MVRVHHVGKQRMKPQAWFQKARVHLVGKPRIKQNPWWLEQKDESSHLQSKRGLERKLEVR